MYEKQHAKVLRLEVSVGNNDDSRTIEEFEQAIRTALTQRTVRAHNVSVQGGYYIIDGKVCMPNDYDHSEKDRIPGTHPPQWAGGPAPEAKAKVDYSPTESTSEPKKFEMPEGYVRAVRDPLTGRKVRSDKGKPRGPREKKDEASE